MWTKLGSAFLFFALSSSVAAQTNNPPVINSGLIQDSYFGMHPDPIWLVRPLNARQPMAPPRIDEFGRTIGQDLWAGPRSILRVRLYCLDADPGDSCVSLRLLAPSGQVLAAGSASARPEVGQLSIDTGLTPLTGVDLTAYEGQSVELTIEGVDSHGATTNITRRVHVDSSARLKQIAHYGYTGYGTTAEELMYKEWASWDVSPTRRLAVLPWQIVGPEGHEGTPALWTRGGWLPEFMRQFIPGSPGVAGFVAAGGAVWIVNTADPEVLGWRQEDSAGYVSGTTFRGYADSDTHRYPMLQAKGSFAAWPLAGTLQRHRVTDRTTTSVATDAYLVSWFLGANGDLVWQDCPDSTCTGGGAIRRSRLGLPAEMLATAPAGAMPATDGIHVVWTAGGAVLRHVEGAVPEVLADGLTVPAFRVANGWIAYTRHDTGGTPQVWVRSPAGMDTQLTSAAAPWVLDALGDTGEVMVTASGRRYYLTIGRPLIDVSSDQGVALWREGQWYVAMGRIFLEVAIPPMPSPDFDGDGHSDLVWRNPVTGENAVWYMNGTTKTGSAALHPVPDGRWVLAVVTDLNGDRHPDLIWRHRYTGTNVVWLMDGTTITATMDLPFVTDPGWLLIAGADLDQDGQSDLIWRHPATGSNVVWYMNGTAIRTSAYLPAQFDPAWWLAAVIDMTGDRLPDLVWRNVLTGANKVWRMNGAAYVSTVALPGMPAAWVLAAVQDLDGDAAPDLVWRATRAIDRTPAGANAVWFMDGTTVRSTDTLETVADMNWTIAHGNLATVLRATPSDFNADGRPDLVWRSAATGGIVIWFMRDGAWVDSAWVGDVPDANWQLVGAGDLDGDGHSDFVWRNVATGSNVVWFMDETAIRDVASLPAVLDLTWRLVAVTDLDRNGTADLIWRHLTTGDNTVWYMRGAQVAASAALPARPDAQWLLVGAGDVNGDDAPDLIWRHPASGANQVWYLSGATPIGAADLPALADPFWQLAVTTDTNGDGAIEFLWQHVRTGALQRWYLSGTTLAAAVPEPGITDTTWSLIRANPERAPAIRNDLNGDGHADLLWRHPFNGANVVWYLTGATRVGSEDLPAVPDWTWELAGTPDVNGDTHPDQVWWNRGARTMVVWYMQGRTVLMRVSLPMADDPAWALAGVGDVDGDGAPDLVFRRSDTGANAVWYLNGTAILGASALPDQPDPATELAGVVDLDGDGDAELVWRDTVTGATVVWYLDAGVVAASETLADVMGPVWTLAAMPDLNGDGHPDIVWRNMTSGQNVVWYLDGVTPLGTEVLPASGGSWTIVR